MDQLDRPVLYFQSFDQFAYSRIDLSVCTLSQPPSPTKVFRKSGLVGHESHFSVQLKPKPSCVGMTNGLQMANHPRLKVKNDDYVKEAPAYCRSFLDGPPKCFVTLCNVL